MNKLEVGMYVRTIKGIAKITKIEKYYNGFIIETDNYITIDDTGFTEEEMIKRYKASHNIIDLIEVGDYVNGHKVVEVDLDDIDDYGNDFRYIKTEHDYTLNHRIEENYIETILTKEQFESMKYEVSDNNE